MLMMIISWVSINATKKDIRPLTDATKEVCPEENAQKIKYAYILMCSRRNVGQNCNVKTANISSENVAKLKYLGTTMTNENCIRETIKS
jgi:ribosomal protein S2